MASNSLHEQEGEMVADLVEDYFYYEKLISGQILIFLMGMKMKQLILTMSLLLATNNMSRWHWIKYIKTKKH